VSVIKFQNTQLAYKEVNCITGIQLSQKCTVYTDLYVFTKSINNTAKFAGMEYRTNDDKYIIIIMQPSVMMDVSATILCSPMFDIFHSGIICPPYLSAFSCPALQTNW